jgi:hypothetical protein
MPSSRSGSSTWSGRACPTGGWRAVPPGTTSDDLLLAVSMVVGGLSGVGAADRVPRAARAWELLGFEVRIPA